MCEQHVEVELENWIILQMKMVDIWGMTEKQQERKERMHQGREAKVF